MKIKRDPADIVFSQYIRLRDKACRRCGSPVSFNDKGMPVSHQASHFVGRRKENTRFDPDNVDTLCFSCHQYFGENPIDHYDWQVEIKGQDLVDDLKLRANMYTKKDRKAEKMYWQQKLEEL